MTSAIRSWLSDLRLEHYADVFEENDIDLDLAADLAEQDLKDLGVASMGHRKKLLRAIEGLANTEAPSAPPAPAAPISAAAERTSQVERRQLTVMFCDLVGSTALATQLDAEDYRDLIRAYQDTCAGVIQRFGGYVAKYMGDGVLAYFGWPKGNEDDAERAMNAALGLIDAVNRVPPPGAGRDPLALRIGIATGSVLVGDIIGEGASKEAAVTGETPNLAARLLEIGDAGAIVIDATTRALVSGLFEVASMGPQSLKGIEGSIETWRVIKAAGIVSRFEAVHGASMTRFVGRGHELALLLERWELARYGEGQVVLLSGEAGIGKSRLTQALMTSLQDNAHYRLRFQCSPYHAHSALTPIVGHLERSARFAPDDGDPAKLDKLEALLREAGEVPDQTVALIAQIMSLHYETRYGRIDLTPQQAKLRTIEALADQVFGLAQRKPALLVFEDAHWIDPTSLELLELIVSRASHAQLLLVITHRPEWRPPFLGQAHTTSLQLNRLGRRQIAEIVRSISENAIPELIVEHIVNRTDGVPLFVEEMTRSVIEGGVSAATEGGDIPNSLQASLMARLDRLPASAREIAQVASVIGREVNLQLLADASGLGENDIAKPIEDLLNSQLMLKGRIASDAAIVFRHALIRDAAYQSLLSRRRREIHERIAEALERGFPAVVDAQPELVARHFAEAGRVEEAIAYWRRAGGRAAEFVANHEAVDHYRNALARLDLLTSDARRDKMELEIRLELGLPLIAATGYASDAVQDNYERAREISARFGDDDALFAATRGLWNCVYDRGDLDRAFELVDQLVQLANAAQDSDKTLLAQRALGSTEKCRGALDAASTAFEACIAAAEGHPLSAALKKHGEAPQIIAGQYMGWTNCVRGRLDEGLYQVMTANDLARDLAHPLTMAFSLQILSVAHLLRREYEKCCAVGGENARLADEHGFVFWSAGSKVLSGSARAHLGDVEAGLAEAAQGLRDWRATGAGLHVPTWSAFLADAAVCAGAFDMAETVIDDGLRAVHANNERLALAELQRLSGHVALHRGDVDEAARLIETAIATANHQNARLFELRAATDLARLLQEHDGAEPATAALAPVYARFTDSFGCLDLQAAAALLTELNRPPAPHS